MALARANFSGCGACDTDILVKLGCGSAANGHELAQPAADIAKWQE